MQLFVLCGYLCHMYEKMKALYYLLLCHHNYYCYSHAVSAACMVFFPRHESNESPDFSFCVLDPGLIHRGIAMSGSGYCPWAITPSQTLKDRTKALAVLCSCPPEPSHELLKCMQEVPVELIIEMRSRFQVRTFHKKIRLIYASIISFISLRNPANINSLYQHTTKC